MTVTTTTQELQGEILKTVRKGQEAVVDAIQTWADAVQSIKPSLPDLNIPFTDKLPQPAEVVATAYDFVEQLLAAQRRRWPRSRRCTPASRSPAPRRRPPRPSKAAQKPPGPDHSCRGAGPAPSPPWPSSQNEMSWL
jgi:hypothetical protein